MAQTIKIKRSSTSGNKLTSSNSVAGELGLNTADKALYIQTGSSNGDVVTVAHESTLKIDESNGRIGIGTTSPTHQLHVAGAGDIVIEDTGGGSSHLRLKSSASGSTTSHWKLKTNAANHFYIDNDQQGTNPFTILSGGNVGIGITSPGAPLDVKSSSISTQDSGFRLISNQGGNPIVKIGEKGNDKGRFHMFSGTTEKIAFYADGTNNHISAGNLGIGTSSPDSLLHLKSTGDTRMTIESPDDSDAYINFSGASNEMSLGFDKSDSAMYITNHGTITANRRVTIKSTGNVGIGITSPDKMLVVQGPGAEIVISDTDTTDTPRLRFRETGSTSGTIHTDASHMIFSAGGVSERMRINPSGYVGIGTTAPAARLHISGNSDVSDEDCMLIIDDVDGSAGSRIPAIMFRSNTGGTVTNQGRIRGTDTQGIKISGSSALGNDLVVQSGGVGIGTSSPDAKLVVSSGGTTAAHSDTDLLVRHSSAASTTAQVQILSGSTGASNLYFSDTDAYSVGGFQYNHSNNYLAVRVNAAERMRITSNGSVGIGTSSPQRNLDVRHALNIFGSGGYTELMLRGRAGTAQNLGAWHWSIRSDVGGDNDDLMLLRFTGGNSPSYAGTSMHIRNDNGYVGIGTNTGQPSAHLHVKDATGEAKVLIQAGSNTSSAVLQFGDSLDSSRGGIEYTSTDDMAFSTNNMTEAMRIRYTGNVGIGTSNPSGTLHVKSTGNGEVNIERASGALINLQAQSAAGYVGTDSNHLFGLKANGTVRLKIATSGAITFNDEYTFPTADGSANQVLKTDGSGNLSFVTIAGAGGVTEIADADDDTKIQVEESSDEDQIRFDAAGVERLRIGSDVQVIGTTDFNVTGSNRRISFTSGTGTVRTTGSSSLHLATNNTNRLNIASDGKVGIGTSSLTNQFHVSGNARIEGNLMAGGAAATNVPARPIHVKSSGDAAAIRIEDTTSSNLVFDFRVTHDSGLRFINVTGGTTPMFIGDDGKVGIATTSPEAPLHLKGTGDTTLIVEADSDNSGETDNARIELRQDGNNVAGYLYTEGNAGQTATGTIANTTVLESKGGGGDVGIHFATGGRAPAQSGGESNGTVRMTILGSGNVGIGTTSPAKTLTVSGTFQATGEAFFSHFDNISSNSRMRDDLRLNFGTARTFAIAGNSTNMHMKNGTTDVMTFDTSSRVGIGITSPSRKLDVTAPGNDGIRIASTNALIGGGASGGDTQLIYWNGSNAYYGRSALGGTISQHEFRTGGATRLTITSSGSVGIGTTNPGKTLDVRSGTIDVVANFQSTDSGAYIAFKDNTTSTANAVQLGAVGDDLRIDAGDLERVRIKSDGKVGIGTTSPGSILDVVAGTSDSAPAILRLRSGTEANTGIGDVYAGIEMGVVGAENSTGALTNGVTVAIKAIDTRSGETSFEDAGLGFYTTDGSDSAPVLRAVVTDDGGLHVTNDGNIDTVSAGQIKADGNIYGSQLYSGGTRIADSSGQIRAGVINATDVDFIVTDTSDATTNIIWRDHSESKLYLGTSAAQVEFRSDITVGSGLQAFFDGAAAAANPAITFGTDTDTGIIRPTTNTLGFVTGGTERARITSSGHLDINGNNLIDVNQINGVDGSGWLDFNMDTDSVYPQSTSDNQTVLGSITHMNFVGDSNGNGTGGRFYWGYGVSNTDSGTFTKTMDLDRSGNLTLTGALQGPATFTIDPAAVGDNTGTVVIAGNLQVDGTTTTINSTTLTVDDKNITLASGSSNAAAANGAGITVDCGSDTDATLTYVSATDDWKFDKPTRVSGLTNGGIAFTSTETLVDGSSSLPNGRIFYHSSQLIYDSPSSGHRFAVAGNQSSNIAMVIDSNKRVGIGTTSPAYELDVRSSSADASIYVEDGASGGPIRLRSSGSGEAFIYIGSEASSIRRTGGDLNFWANAVDMTFSTNNGSTKHMFISTAGNVGIGTTSPAAKLQVEVAGIDTTTTSTTATTQVAIDTMAAATFRSAKYTIQVTNSTDSTYHITEILLIHDGTTPGITEYGTVFTGSAAEATFDADISSGNVRLLATPASTDSMTFKVVRHCITV